MIEVCLTCYDLQLISTENPFLSVRLSSLALLREEIATAIRSHETDFIVHPDTFWSGLAPLIFALPTADLPLLELPLDSVLQDRIIPWCMECAKILLLLLSCGSEAEEVSQHAAPITKIRCRRVCLPF